MNAPGTRQLALSGLGGLPLAMVALPLYVHTPALLKLAALPPAAIFSGART
ncbi:hypothetical protein ACFSQE_04860 [Vogesella fluminis]|uniref:hypothetical protein n=1 Tax=Vogesella fluminis TaxID=1069161 RepID=UPI001674F800|nr:hypothetical protein [Vogesella fluminis]